MFSFHFDVGNSSEKHIGLCARVTAKDPEAATTQLQEFLEEIHEVELRHLLKAVADKHGIEYCNVYINAGVFAAEDIDDVLKAEEEDPS